MRFFIVLCLYVAAVLWLNSFGGREISLPDVAKCKIAAPVNADYPATFFFDATTSLSLSVIKEGVGSLAESGLASNYSFVKYDLLIKNGCKIIPHDPILSYWVDDSHHLKAIELSELQAQSEPNYNFTNLTCKRDPSIVLKTNEEKTIPFSLGASEFEEIIPYFLQKCTLRATASSTVNFFLATGTVSLVLKPTYTSWLFSLLLSFTLVTGIFPITREAWRVVNKRIRYFSDS